MSAVTSVRSEQFFRDLKIYRENQKTFFETGSRAGLELEPPEVQEKFSILLKEHRHNNRICRDNPPILQCALAYLSASKTSKASIIDSKDPAYQSTFFKDVESFEKGAQALKKAEVFHWETFATERDFVEICIGVNQKRFRPSILNHWHKSIPSSLHNERIFYDLRVLDLVEQGFIPLHAQEYCPPQKDIDDKRITAYKKLQPSLSISSHLFSSDIISKTTAELTCRGNIYATTNLDKIDIPKIWISNILTFIDNRRLSDIMVLNRRWRHIAKEFPETFKGYYFWGEGFKPDSKYEYFFKRLFTDKDCYKHIAEILLLDKIVDLPELEILSRHPHVLKLISLYDPKILPLVVPKIVKIMAQGSAGWLDLKKVFSHPAFINIPNDIVELKWLVISYIFHNPALLALIDKKVVTISELKTLYERNPQTFVLLFSPRGMNRFQQQKKKFKEFAEEQYQKSPLKLAQDLRYTNKEDQLKRLTDHLLYNAEYSTIKILDDILPELLDLDFSQHSIKRLVDENPKGLALLHQYSYLTGYLKDLIPHAEYSTKHHNNVNCPDVLAERIQKLLSKGGQRLRDLYVSVKGICNARSQNLEFLGEQSDDVLRKLILPWTFSTKLAQYFSEPKISDFQ